MVADGIDALAIRLLLANQADHCIDTQYYEIEDDLAGHLFIEALLRAADRGVRVRLLLDDYRTGGHDAGLADADTADLITVRWPDGDETLVRDVHVNRVLTIVKGGTRAESG